MIESLANQFLISMPAMQDSNFSKTVSLICQHDENGSMGVIINRPMPELSLTEILAQLNINVKNKTQDLLMEVYTGGPVHPELGMVLHTEPGNWDSTLMVGDDFGLTTSIDIIQAIAEGQGPANRMLILGYAGWSAGQLEHEITQNSWLNCGSSDQIIFNTPYNKRWQAAADQLGVDMSTLSHLAGHA